MVELRTRKREMRGDGGNHHAKLGLKSISCASQFAIPNSAGRSPDSASNITDTRSAEHNEARCTPDFSYLLISSISFSSSSPITLCLSHTSTIIAEHKVKTSRCISPCHDHELTPSCSIHRVKHTLSPSYTVCSINQVQHTPSAADTEWSIHQVQHTPSAAYTKCSMHQVQHTPSAAYTKCSIHQVQHSPSTVYH